VSKIDRNKNSRRRTIQRERKGGNEDSDDADGVYPPGSMVSYQYTAVVMVVP